MMKMTSINLFAFLLSLIALPAMAQVPNCAGPDSAFIFLHQGNNIMAYDPAQPLSGTNPFVYVANPGPMAGLTVSNNLNGGTPSPAFYTNSGGSYAWYNGTNWQTTGHTVSTVNPGGGINFIYSKNGGTGEINKYDGTGPATFLVTTYPGSGPYDLVTDNQDNFYHLMTSINPGKIIKYSPAGLPLDSFVVTGHPIQTAGGGFAMIGNMVYAVFNSSPSFYAGPIIGGNCVLSPVGQMAASDVATCPASVPSVTSNPVPIAAFTVSDDTICVGECVTFTDMTINSPTAWTWTFPGATPGSSILQNPGTVCFNTPGNHIVQLIATNAVGSDTATLVVHVDFLAPLSIAGDLDLCIGESTTLTVNPAAQGYLWSNAQTTQSITETPSQTTTYTVIVSEGACVDTTSVTVEVNPLPTISAVAEMTGCNNNNGSVITTTGSGTPPYAYSWNNGQTTPDAQGVGTGVYSVTVTDSKGCTATASAEVFMYPNPVATLTPDSTTIRFGDTVQFIATGGLHYFWTPPTYLNFADIPNPKSAPMEDISYCVVVSDEHDCRDTVCADVKVIYCDDFFIPNAFSPNGDGLNDKFQVKGTCFTHYQFKIQNRWGQTVFESQHSGESWDGSYKGVKCDPGVYFYYAEVTFINGKRFIRKGDVTLLR